MKTVAITGHTGEIGKHVADAFKEAGFSIVGISRSTGYDLQPGQLKSAVDRIKDCDVFVNLFGAGVQKEILELVWAEWRDNKEKLIISLGSLVTSIPSELHDNFEYSMQKMDLNDKFWQLIDSCPYPKMTLVRSAKREFEEDYKNWAKFLVKLTNQDYHILDIAYLKL